MFDGEREAKVRWLFSGNGEPIAFLFEGAVYSPKGRYIGVLEGEQVIDSKYVGHVIGDRLLRLRLRPHVEMKERKRKDVGFEPDPPPKAEPVKLPLFYQEIGRL